MRLMLGEDEKDSTIECRDLLEVAIEIIFSEEIYSIRKPPSENGLTE